MASSKEKRNQRSNNKAKKYRVRQQQRREQSHKNFIRDIRHHYNLAGQLQNEMMDKVDKINEAIVREYSDLESRGVLPELKNAMELVKQEITNYSEDLDTLEAELKSAIASTDSNDRMEWMRITLKLGGDADVLCEEAGQRFANNLLNIMELLGATHV